MNLNLDYLLNTCPMNTKYNKYIFLPIITSLLLIPSTWAIWRDNSQEQEQVASGTSLILGIFTLKNGITLLLMLTILVITFIISKTSTKWMNKIFHSEEAVEDPVKAGLYGLLHRTIIISIRWVGLTLTLAVAGVNVWFFLGWIGIGLGFTMQIFLSNFIFGIMMVVQGTLRTGDLIDLNGELMIIEKVHPLFTEVRKLDGVKKFTPNIKFLEESFSNITLNGTRRVEIDFTLDYTNDTSKVKTILAKVVQVVPGIIPHPEYQVWFTDLQENGMGVRLLFWIQSKESYFMTRSNVIETLNTAFRQAKISVAFPQVSISQRGRENIVERYS